MRREKWLTVLTGSLLSFLLSFACAACIATAFDIAADGLADLRQIALWCALISLLGSIFNTWRYGVLLVGALAILAVICWRFTSLEISIEALLNTISKRYHNGYGWQIIQWSDADLLSADRTMALQAIASVIAACTSWTVCTRRPIIWALLVGLLPLISCTLILSTVPAEKYLFLWLLAMILLLLTQQTRRRNANDGSKLTLIAVLPVGLALALLFYFVPKEGYAHRARAERLLMDIEELFRGAGSFIGMDTDDEIDLTKVGMLKERRVPVMEVTATHTDTYYLRGRAYDVYTGTRWKDSGNETTLAWPRSYLSVSEITIQTRYTEDVMYLPYYTDAMLLQTVGSYVDNRDGVKEYSFVCYMPAVNLSTGEMGVYPNIEELRAMTQLPHETQQWAQEWLDQYVPQYESFDEITLAEGIIADDQIYNAVYDLNTPIIDSEYTDFAQWFLMESDTGYCVHFATTATVLLRAAGIPARYVTGYMVEAVGGEEVTVYQKNAHAWVEYWSASGGWRIIDPTPAAQEELPPETTETTTEETTEEVTEETTKAPPTTTEPTEETKETTRETQSHTPSLNAQKTEDSYDFTRLLRPLKWVGIAALFLAVVLGQWRLRVLLRMRARAKGSTNQRALAAWRQSLKYAFVLGKKANAELFELANRAKFSQYMITERELRQFEAYFRTCITRLRAASWYKRLYYRLILALY